VPKRLAAFVNAYGDPVARLETLACLPSGDSAQCVIFFIIRPIGSANRRVCASLKREDTRTAGGAVARRYAAISSTR